MLHNKCQRYRFIIILFMISIGFMPSPGRTALAQSTDPVTLHVDADPTNSSVSPAGAGDTWGVGHAYRFLQDAITQANFLLEQTPPVPSRVEIWIANGTYRPDQYAGTTQTEAGTGDPTATFAMREKVLWYGGFAGTETVLNDRNPSTNVTTLSGAINGDTAYHVVTAIRVDITARMDGFTVTGGDAAGAPAPENTNQGEGGGGMLIYGEGTTGANSASPVVLRCIFTTNGAKYGGGVWFRGSELSHPTFYNCRFVSNTATEDGGGFYCNDQIGTFAPGLGGKPKFANCIFDVNTATNGGGGALYCQTYSVVEIINCTITRNTAVSASAIFHGSGCSFDEGSLKIRNSIIWENEGDDHVEGAATITNSCLTDLAWCNCTCPSSPPGPMNIDDDPLFNNASAGNYRLACGSPCLNVGKNDHVPNDDFDIDQDGIGPSSTEPLPEYDLKDRILGAQSPATVDMGAFERAVAPNEICNGEADGIASSLGVNIDDLVTVIVHWGPCPGSIPGCPGDIYPVPCGNGVVNIDDLNVVITTWCCGATESCQEFPMEAWDCYNACLETRGDFGECVVSCLEALGIYNP